jgi:hypothetical protein
MANSVAFSNEEAQGIMQRASLEGKTHKDVVIDMIANSSQFNTPIAQQYIKSFAENISKGEMVKASRYPGLYALYNKLSPVLAKAETVNQIESQKKDVQILSDFNAYRKENPIGSAYTFFVKTPDTKLAPNGYLIIRADDERFDPLPSGESKLSTQYVKDVIDATANSSIPKAVLQQAIIMDGDRAVLNTDRLPDEFFKSVETMDRVMKDPYYNAIQTDEGIAAQAGILAQLSRPEPPKAKEGLSVTRPMDSDELEELLGEEGAKKVEGKSERDYFVSTGGYASLLDPMYQREINPNTFMQRLIESDNPTERHAAYAWARDRAIETANAEMEGRVADQSNNIKKTFGIGGETSLSDYAKRLNAKIGKAPQPMFQDQDYRLQPSVGYPQPNKPELLPVDVEERIIGEDERESEALKESLKLAIKNITERHDEVKQSALGFSPTSRYSLSLVGDMKNALDILGG